MFQTSKFIRQYHTMGYLFPYFPSYAINTSKRSIMNWSNPLNSHDIVNIYVSDRIYLGDVQGLKNAITQLDARPDDEQVKMIEKNLIKHQKRQHYLIKRYDYLATSIVLCGYTGIFAEAVLTEPLMFPISILFACGTLKIFKASISNDWITKYTDMKKVIDDDRAKK